MNCLSQTKMRSGGGSVNGSFSIVDVTISGDASRIIIPKSRVSGTAVVYCHGLMEFVSDLSMFSPRSVDQKHWYFAKAVQHGYLLAAGKFGGDTWDNATAQTALENLVAYLVANYSVTEIVLWSQSAGGPLGLLKSTQGFSGVTVKGWFGIYPIVNLDAAHSNGALTASINAAFPSYPTDASGRDPILLSASSYDGLRLRCCQSASDTVAPKSIHGDALVTLTTGHATEVTCVATTGDHGDPSNFTKALADDFIEFLGRCFP